MSRYSAMFARCAAAEEGAFGAFLVIGDPTPDEFLAAVDAAIAGGADFLELGIPFSDPVADGPIIQAAARRALSAGVRTAQCFDLLATVRERHPDVPVGVLTYANIALARGFDAFCSSLAGAGVDSLLIADIPHLEAPPFARAARDAGLDWVMIAASNCSDQALDSIAETGSGYTYVVARAGVTGSDTTRFAQRDLIDLLAARGAAPPVLGFGIGTPGAVAAALGQGAAGVISGSAIVERLAAGDDLASFVATLKAATRG